METAMRDSLKRTHPKIPDLSTYDRYYWGVTIEGSPVILGRVLVLPAHETGVHRASDWDNGPIILDGRCDNIHVAYDVKASKFTQLACDGESDGPAP
jgi:hypothetical protein